MTWEFYSVLVYCWNWTFYMGLLSVNNDTSMSLLTVHIVPYLTSAKLGSGNETMKIVFVWWCGSIPTYQGHVPDNLGFIEFNFCGKVISFLVITLQTM